MDKNSLIFLHGWGSEPEVWHKQIAHFKDGFSVSAPQLYEFEGLPCGKDAIFVGWSLGGMIALEYAYKNPGCAKALVLISSTPRFIKSEDLPFGTHRGFVRRMRKRVCAGPREALEWFNKLAAVTHRPLRKSSLDTGLLCKWLTRLEEMDLRPLLGEIKIPCLIIHSDDDEVVSVEAARYLDKNLPHSKLHIVKGGGHAPFLTDADKVNALIEGFIRD